MKLGQAGEDLIKGFESYLDKLPDGRCKAYICPAGKATIGWGCTKGVRMGMIWTREQADEGFRQPDCAFQCRDADILRYVQCGAFLGFFLFAALDPVLLQDGIKRIVFGLFLGLNSVLGENIVELAHGVAPDL